MCKSLHKVSKTLKPKNPRSKEWRTFVTLRVAYSQREGRVVSFWVAAKELKLNYHDSETILCILHPYYGTSIYSISILWYLYLLYIHIMVPLFIIYPYYGALIPQRQPRFWAKGFGDQPANRPLRSRPNTHNTSVE